MTTRKQADQAQKAIPATAHKTTRKSTGKNIAARLPAPNSTAANSNTQRQASGSTPSTFNAANYVLLTDPD